MTYNAHDRDRPSQGNELTLAAFALIAEIVLFDEGRCNAVVIAGRPA
jgi:hypothetical protein